MSPGHFAPGGSAPPLFRFISRLGHLDREHRKFLFETRFGPGMLLDKPGHELP